MKVNYRSHEIEVVREMCLAGYPLLYYSIYRDNDGYGVADGVYEGSETVREFVGYMRERLDAEIEEGSTYE